MLERRLKKHNTEIDIEEINMAIEMTVENENKESKEDAKLLKGVVQLGQHHRKASDAPAGRCLLH
jgi:hypothetical protein